ncbi:amino acid adenylation domain-containing protein, partial [Desulfovibrio sp. OttesenSCG-928-M16]|nr:amino acid adenylation domain-containing protein [Desulfovibrio sp. OttesenSCG-928-M16]
MQTEHIAVELLDMAQSIFGLSPEDLDPDVGILELGLDSLMIIKLGQEIERRWGVPLEASWFLSTMPSLATLASHVEALRATAVTTSAQPKQAATIPCKEDRPDDAGLALCSAQLRAMQELFASQLAALTGTLSPPPALSSPANRSPQPCVAPASPTSPSGQSTGARPHLRGFVLEQTPLTERQTDFVRNLVQAHLAKTKGSRALGRQSPVLADWKSTLSFRPEFKDIAYPIVADTMRSGRFIDVDGNEFIDIAVGMGVHFLGHSPDFVEKALRNRLDRGFGLGPQCDLTSKAAEGVSTLTGMERVTFCNTGSEAVMFALRLARAKSGKPLVALFSGSYHGTFDGVLGAQDTGDVVPSSPGVLPGMVQDIILLDYNAASAFERLEAIRDHLAAVLVEPVQSRRPGLQPQTFLRRLRRFTQQHGICLIFDEMVNGFRIAPGGSQEHFGVKADMALYGKVIGGGVPIGVIAGKKDYLDYIDGGFLGEDGVSPSGETIAFGGTFCRHPFAMEAVAAVTEHLKEHGRVLCDRTTTLTQELADTLNLWFQDNDVPLRLMHYGAQFIFESYGRYSAFAQPIELQIFYLLLMHKGVYTWERRTCGLATGHDRDDVARIARAVKESVEELREGGFDFRSTSRAPVFFLPMTPTQERLFAIFQREHGQDAYHLPLAWRLQGAVDADLTERLEIALGEIILRHEALRTAFVQLEGRLLQQVVPEPVFFLEKTISDGSPEEQLRSFIRPFDLSRPPLLRARLAGQPDGSFLFMLDVLHIAADGASLGLILDDLNLLMQDKSPESRPVSFQLASASLSSQGAEDDARYWAERLKDFPALELPYDQPTFAGSPEGGQQWMRIEADALSQAKSACKAYGVTLNMFLNGVYVLFLQALSRGERFCVGMADGGRYSPEAERAVGMFVNTVPQLFTADPNIPLREFFTGIRLACAESMSRNRAPYGDIVERLGFSPASTMLSYERADHRTLDWPSVTATPVAAHGQGAMYDFAIDIVEMDGVLHCNLIHSKAFLPESARAFGEAFAQILREAASRTECRVNEIDLLPPAQLAALRREWRDSAHPPDGAVTVLEAIHSRCQLSPEVTALVLDHEGEQERVSYAALWKKSDALAARLISAGVRSGSIVGILLTRCPGFVIACLAAMKAGAAYLPITPDLPGERLAFMLEDAEAAAVISSPELLPLLTEYAGPALDIALADSPPPDGMSLPVPGGRDLAYVIYTSGTTGRPKGVMVEHHSLYNSCRWCIRHYGISGDDRTTAFAPFIFDASLWEIFPMLMQSATVHILHEDIRLNLPQVHDYLRRHAITVAYFLSQVSELIDGRDLPDLRLILCGGDVMRIPEARGKHRHSNLYGPTEFTITSHAYDLDGAWPVPMGFPLDNTQSLILDAHGRMLPAGFPGELCLSGEQIARGYLKRPELTAAAFRPNPMAAEAPEGSGTDYSLMYATGDLCRRTSKGAYMFMGRLDGQVKIRGHRVETGEIESRLLEHPHVSQAVVRALAYEDEHKYLCAYVVPSPDAFAETLEEELKSSLTRSLPHYMAPKEYVFLNALPYRANGKVNLDALPAPQRTASVFTPPQGKSESILAGLWEEHLHKKPVGRNDNFFDLGGDSIKALMLTAGVRAAGYTLRARDIFTAPVLSELARHLEPLVPEKTPAAHRSASSARPAPDPTPDPALDQTDERRLRDRYGTALLHITPPSAMQLGMLFHQRLQSDTDMYVEQSLLAVRGPLDPEALRSRFFSLIQRHESLRSVIVETSVSRPLLLILAADAVPAHAFVHIDLSRENLEPEALLQRLREDARIERAALRDLSRPPLTRIRLYTTGESEYRLLFTIHHAFFDGWSGGVFFEELLKPPYTADSRAPARPHAEAVPFRAYLDWLHRQDWESARDWWRVYLDGIEERTSLPGHKPNPDAPREDRILPLTLTPDLEKRLRRLARECRATMNTVLQAAWAIVLSRANQHEDIVFGEVVSGRPQELDGMAEIIGLCANTTPVRARCVRGISFRPLVRDMRDKAIDAQAMNWLPLPEIQAQTALRSDLFSHFFVMENYPAPRRAGDLEITLVDGFSRTNFDFALSWEPEFSQGAPEQEPRLTGSFLYNAAALPDWQARVLADAYVTLLEAIAAEPDADIASHELLPSDARQAQLEAFAPRRKHLPEEDTAALINGRARSHPEAVALVYGAERLTYAKLDEASRRLAGRIAALPPSPDGQAVVAVFLERGNGFAVACLAAMKAGAAFVPLDAETPEDRLRYYLEDARVQAVLGQPSLQTRIPRLSWHIPFLDVYDPALYREGRDEAENFTPAPRQGDAAAYIIYTSGTTGLPKGVVISHRSLTNQVLWSVERYGIRPHDRLTFFASHAFDVALWEMLPTLAAGGELHVLNDEVRQNPEKLHAYLRDQAIRNVWLPPHLATVYLKEYSVRGLRSLTAGGDRFAPGEVCDAQADFALYNNYGPTECAITSTSHRFSAGDAVTIGKPVLNTPCYILDTYGHLQPTGFPGELHIGGPQVALGYLRRPDLTARRFIPDPFCPEDGGRMYASGDLCRFLPDGQLVFMGRLDAQLKIRGYRLEPGEVERTLLRHPLLRQCVVAARTGASGNGTRLLAWGIPAENASGSDLDQIILREASQWLPAYMLPEALILVDSFPLSASGKVRLDALPDPPAITPETEYLAPDSPEQALLADALQTILGRERLSLSADFFQLGGDSITAMQLTASLSRHGYDLTVKDIFQAGTLRSLAGRMRAQPTAPSGAAESLPPAGPAAACAPDDERALRRRYAREGVEGVYPLTPMQAGMLFDMRHDKTADADGLYWIENEADIRGHLDSEALETRLHELVSRHEALRLVIVEDGVRFPVQAVLRHKPGAFLYEDLSHLPEEQQSAAMAAARERQRLQPSRLDKDPLLRLLLFRLAPDSFRMVLLWHHIVLDGWSLGLLLQELFAPESALIPAPGVSAYLARMGAGDERAHREWWERTLSGEPTAACIPPSPEAAADSAARATDAMQSVCMTLDRFIDERLRAFARNRRVTVGSILLTIWGLLLSRYTDCEDLVFATLSSGRSSGPDADRVVGPCISSLPLRFRCPFDTPFEQLVRETQALLSEAMEHDHCSPASLRGLLGVGYGKTLFVMENQPSLPGDVGLSVTPTSSFGRNGLDLAMEWQDSGVLQAVLHYAPRLYEVWRMDNLAEHFLLLLEDALQRPDAPSGTLTLLSPAEERRLLVHCNATERDWPEKSFIDLFLQTASIFPDNTALAGPGQTFSYAELLAKAVRLARSLRADGLRRGDAVGIALPRTAAYPLAQLGIMLAGGAFVPLSPEYPASRLREILEDCGARGLIVEGNMEGLSLPASTRTYNLEALLAAEHPDDDTSALPNPDDPAYILYTSGSTGKPKGVIIPHKGLANLCRWFVEANDVSPDDVFSVYAPFIFDASIYEAFPALISGAAVHVIPEDIRLDEEALAAFFRQHAVSVAFLPPMVGKTLLQDREFERLRVLTFAGERPGPLEPQPFKLLNAYGPTEFTVCAASWEVTRPCAAPPIGSPVANTHCHILDSRQRLLPFGVPGELYYSGIQLAKGYVNLPDKTTESFLPNPFSTGDARHARMYRSGDRCRRDRDGTLEFLGRADRQIKLRGQRLEPQEIEQVLLRHPAIAEAAVTLRKQGDGGILQACVTVSRDAGKQGAAPKAPEILHWLSEHLPEWMLPSDLLVLDAMPLTVNGKIDREALSRLSGASGPSKKFSNHDAPAQGQEDPPATEGGKRLAEVWQLVLGLQQIDPAASFFALGGDSIKAMQIVSRMRASGYRLTTRQIFRLQKLERLYPVLAPLLQDEVAPSLTERHPHVGTLRPDAADQAILEAAFPGVKKGALRALALTPMQEALVAHSFLHPGSPDYLEQSRLDIEGPLDIQILRENLESAARRHEMLRTVFCNAGTSRPYQVVLEDLSPTFSVHDIRSLSHQDQEETINRALETVRKEGLDLRRGPLLRLDLYRLEDERTALLVSFHHAVLDGWSMQLLLGELLSPAPSPTPGPDFSAYAEWLALRDTAADTAWWREYLENAAPPELGLAYNTASTAYSNRSCLRSISAPLTQTLETMAGGLGFTMHTLLAAAWGVVLARHSNRESAVFGTVLSGRSAPVPNVEDMLGLLVRTAPVHISCPDRLSIRDMLRKTQEEAGDIEEHSSLPLPDILKLTPYGAELISCLFVFENLPENDPPSNLRLRPRGGFNQTPYPATLIAEHHAATQEVQLRLQYNGSLLSSPEAESLLAQMECVLGMMAENPDAPVGSLELLTPAERGRMLRLSLAASAAPDHDAAAPSPDVIALFQRAVAAYPERPALAAGNRSWTYAELDRQSDALAQRLLQSGIGPESVVAVMLERSPECVVALLGILKAGAAYIIVDPALPEQRRAFLLHDAGAHALVTIPGAPSRAWAVPTNFSGSILYAPACFSSVEPSLPLPDRRSDQAAYIIYTSGSTGAPKGVVVEHAALSNFCRWHRDFYRVVPDDVAGHVFSFSFDASAWGIFPLLAAGGSVHILEGEDRVSAARVREYFDRHGVTLANIPALFMEEFHELAPPRALRLLTSGGDTLRTCKPVPYETYNEYGPSEATIMCACHRLQDGEQPVPIGRPIAGAGCLVLDVKGRMQPCGAVGELHISGPPLARAYLNRPGETQQAFIPNPYADIMGEGHGRLYKTGDLCRMRPDGVLEFLGRGDDQISIRGHRVETGEIEQTLLGLPGIACAVVAARARSSGMALTAYVVPEAPLATYTEEQAAAWKTALRELLPSWMLPDAWVTLPSLPLTANGKIDRAALPEPDFAAGAGSGEPARSGVELALAGLWQQVLDLPSVTLDDDFFTLGGDSLKAARLAASAEEMFGIRLAVTDFMRHATLRSLAAQVESPGRTAGHSSLLVPLKKGSRTALVLVPSLGGSLLCYKGLLDALPGDLPVYALNPQELPDAHDPACSLRHMASAYEPCLRETFPDGNIWLLGLCMGGMTAWEIACQLEENGACPRGVISFNTRARLLVDDQGRPLDLACLPESLRSVPDEAIESGLETMRRYEGSDQVFQADGAAAYIRSQLTAWGGYVPRPCGCPMLCLRPEEAVFDEYLPFETRSLGWDGAALGGVRDLYVPGSHYSMLSPPHAATTASLIMEQLREPPLSGGHIPLTPIQRWFFELPMRKGQFFQSVTLQANARRPALRYQRALAALAQRHEMLRAAYIPDAARPGLPPAQGLIATEHWQNVIGLHICEAGRLEEAQRAVARNQRLERPPLAWCLVGQAPEEDGSGDRLVMMCHHLIVDGISWRILLHDFAAALCALDQKKPISLPSAP